MNTPAPRLEPTGEVTTTWNDGTVVRVTRDGRVQLRPSVPPVPKQEILGI